MASLFLPPNSQARVGRGYFVNKKKEKFYFYGINNIRKHCDKGEAEL
jgi:hypothetical protein